MGGILGPCSPKSVVVPPEARAVPPKMLLVPPSKCCLCPLSSENFRKIATNTQDFTAKTFFLVSTFEFIGKKVRNTEILRQRPFFLVFTSKVPFVPHQAQTVPPSDYCVPKGRFVFGLHLSLCPPPIINFAPPVMLLWHRAYQNTLENGIHNFPAWCSALQGRV